MNIVFAAAQKGEFAAKLSGMMWEAYGKPVKFVFWCAVAVFGTIFVVGFVKKLTR